VLNKIDLVNRDELDAVRQQVHGMMPGSRIIEVTQGRVPLALVFGDAVHSVRTQSHGDARNGDNQSHDHVFASWAWTNEHPLSLPKLRSALETLPDAVYRCKGIVYLEEIPVYRYVLQMVGKRYHLTETDRWGTESPHSEIVLIGGQEGIDAENLQHTFDACIRTGDDANSPILRLVRKIAPELLSADQPDRVTP
jgi:G3E family GTPase